MSNFKAVLGRVLLAVSILGYFATVPSAALFVIFSGLVPDGAQWFSIAMGVFLILSNVALNVVAVKLIKENDVSSQADASNLPQKKKTLRSKVSFVLLLLLGLFCISFLWNFLAYHLTQAKDVISYQLFEKKLPLPKAQARGSI